MRRLFGMLLRSLAVLSLLAAVLVGWLILGPGRRVPSLPAAQDFAFLDQGWGGAADSPGRARFYYTPLGSSLHGLRYDWLVRLEMPWGRSRFAEPSHLRAYGFVVDPTPTAANPDQLPVGFTRRYDAVIGEAVLDLSCAACHTRQLVFDNGGRRTALRIDGGPAAQALRATSTGHLVPALTASLASTYLNPIKFRRFGRRVLGERYDAGKWQLHSDLGGVLWSFVRDWARSDAGPEPEGPGRVDLTAALANAVFSRPLAGRGWPDVNARTAHAPVRFAPLWGAWKRERLRCDGSAVQTMAHDVGEAFVAGAALVLLDRHGRPVPAEERGRSSVELENVHRIETALQSLGPPRWPEELLGRIDRAKAERGRALFERHCRSCHGPVEQPAALKAFDSPLRGPLDPLWRTARVSFLEVGSDPAAALAAGQATVDVRRAGLDGRTLREVLAPVLAEYRARLARLLSEIEAARAPGVGPAELEAGLGERRRRLEALESRLARLDPERVPLSIALAVVARLVREERYAARGLTPEQQACLDGFAALDLPDDAAAYVARPLAGAWAAFPFLHNGSVPTLYQLLSPQAERDQRFHVVPGAFDPLQVGVDRRAQGDGFWFDTRLPGNSNVGHEFRAGYTGARDEADPQYGVIGPALAPDERWALVEYLKIHEDPREPGRTPPDCGLR